MALRLNRTTLDSNRPEVPSVSGVIANCDCEPPDGIPTLWIVFQIDGQNHLHLQCPICSTSYCPALACESNVKSSVQ